jgi:hypothetical protein
MAKAHDKSQGASSPDQAHEPGEYEVGYGRPPLASRFQPGRSGNPKGRPKGAKNLTTLTREKLDAKVSVREGGREKRMSKGEIGVTKLVNRFAETGAPKLFVALTKLQEAGVSGQGSSLGAAGSKTAGDQGATDEAILKWFLAHNTPAEESSHE